MIFKTTLECLKVIHLHIIKRMETMKTTINDMEVLYTYLNKTGANYTVDRNPTKEKIERIKQSILRKAELFSKAVEQYKSADNTSVTL